MNEHSQAVVQAMIDAAIEGNTAKVQVIADLASDEQDESDGDDSPVNPEALARVKAEIRRKTLAKLDAHFAKHPL